MARFHSIPWMLLTVLTASSIGASGVSGVSGVSEEVGRSSMSAERRAELQEQLALLPEAVRQVFIDEHAGDTIPLDLKFTDSTGQTVSLGDYFGGRGRGDVPVILTLNYYRCPKLCDVLMNGTAKLVDELDLVPGTDYRIVTVGFDPAEPASLAKMKRSGLLNTMARQEEAGLGWSFLVGDQPAIDALTEAVGFNYTWLESEKQYAHPAALIVLSPEGRITRYIYGTSFQGRESTVRLSLVEAAEGKIGSPLDILLLTCFHYSPTEGKYTPAVMGIMRLGAGLTMLALVGGIGLLLLRERLGRRQRAEISPIAAHHG